MSEEVEEPNKGRVGAVILLLELLLTIPEFSRQITWAESKKSQAENHG